MRKFIAIALVFTMALGLTACAGGGSEIHRLNMATGGDAGTYYAFGGVIASVLTSKIDNVEVTAQTSGGSIDNARKLKNKEAEIAFMQNDVLQYAVTGTESMKDDGAMENLCAIASLYPEAVQLVMLTCAMAHNGELYVLDMGKPVKILSLAENMIRLSGYTPYKDIDIVEVGLRPGEKLYEELLLKSEGLQKTDNHLIYIGHQMMYTPEEIDEKLEKLRGVIYAEAPEVRECVLSLIQEPADKMYDEIPTGEEKETATV